MRTRNRRKSWIVLLAILALFAGCKGESPTAPPPGGTDTGSTTPPTGVVITLSTSNPSPLVDSLVTVTANVTQNGAVVANGTAVEFSTSNGTFTDTNAPTTIRTTTNGVATATLTSSTAGAARVTVTVNNVLKTTDVSFQARSTPPPVTPTTPTITSIAPAIGNPAGGQVIRITGTNFNHPPVRVLFDLGGASPVEGFVQAVTDTTIDVVAPAVNVGSAQELIASITVITQAGTTSEQSVTKVNSFTYRNEVLTPVVSAVSPNSGPVTGGTRVTIFGDGFQSPVQVLFGSAEAHVVDVSFHQIIVEAPSGRDTSPGGSDTVTGPVDVTVINIHSNTRVTSSSAFRYVAAMRITAFTPNIGTALGGTDVTIDGIGFLAPVSVLIGDVQATVLRVSGTQLLVRTGALASPCSSGAVDITVTNVDNGDTATSPIPFNFVGVSPLITSVAPNTGVAQGASVQVIVANPGVGQLGTALVGFSVNGTTVASSPTSVASGTTPQQFTVPIPSSGFTFPTQACSISGSAGLQALPVDAPLVFTNRTTTCTAATTVRVNPPSSACIVAPQAVQTAPAAGTC